MPIPRLLSSLWIDQLKNSPFGTETLQLFNILNNH